MSLGIVPGSLKAALKCAIKLITHKKLNVIANKKPQKDRGMPVEIRNLKWFKYLKRIIFLVLIHNTNRKCKNNYK